MKWFYQTDNREVGPLTETALKELTASGVINKETPVRREDSTEWQPCAIAFSLLTKPEQQPGPEPCPPPIEDPNSPQSKMRRKKAHKRKEAIMATLIAMTLMAVGAGAIFFSTGRGAGKGKATQQNRLFCSTSADPFVNDLGMKFVSVALDDKPDGKKVLFSIWETRVGDFAKFVDESGYRYELGSKPTVWEDGKIVQKAVAGWREPGFSQNDQHPVTCVSWDDAVAFCKWLTKKERLSGKIPVDTEYRLPTDEEWSWAVGIGKEELSLRGMTPEKKGDYTGNEKIYPWGSWPPNARTGNYGDNKLRIKLGGKLGFLDSEGNIYDDGFAFTSPVANFPSNHFGIFDLSGNVYEWCEDTYNGDSKYRTLRGGAWNRSLNTYLNSSNRNLDEPGNRFTNNGFRCVLSELGPDFGNADSNPRVPSDGTQMQSGNTKPTDQGVADLKARAESGDAQAQYELGYDYLNKTKESFNTSEAVMWLKKSADQGFAAAQMMLGVCYAEGIEFPVNHGEAVKWYRKSADQGFADAQVALGACYEYGRGVTVDHNEAVKWCRLAADKDHAVAQCGLGMFYLEGKGVSKDVEESAKWFRLSAEQGNDTAQSFLGALYLDGIGVPQNDTESFKWYQKAAVQGVAIAQFNLSGCYATGRGVAKNLFEEVKWIRKAAEQGHAKSQLVMGSNFIDGNGVDRDLIFAYMWFNLAAISNEQDVIAISKEQLSEIAKSMSSEQILKAQELCRAWKPKTINRSSSKAWGSFGNKSHQKTELTVQPVRLNLSNGSSNPIVPETSGSSASGIPSSNKQAISGEVRPKNQYKELSTSESKRPPELVAKPTLTHVDPNQHLEALNVLKNATIDEAKECIRQLDEELKNDSENTRIKLVKSTIMDVFRAEASLIAALKRRSDADKQYQIKMQNLQIASRPSPLTGRVNTAEVERIRRDANEIKTSSLARINAAKTDLSKSLNAAKRVIPSPDSEPLSRVWSQIESRNNL
jgi:TPR repeat protein/formylglycine-generating enzyme required for sulfatase activity